MALRYGDFATCLKLIKKGAPIDSAYVPFGKRPLYYAAENGHLNITRHILDNGAKVNARNKYGMSSLLAACRGGHLNVVKFLLERSADIHVKDDFDRTVIHFAAASGSTELLRYLIQEKEICYDMYCKTNKSALHYASQHGHHEAIAYLLNRPGHPSIDFMDDTGRTALCWACRSVENKNAVRALLCHNAQIDSECLAQDRTGLLRLVIKKFERETRNNNKKNKKDMNRLFTETELEFLRVLKDQLDIVLPVYAYKTFRIVRSYITFENMFMAHGYQQGWSSVWDEATTAGMKPGESLDWIDPNPRERDLAMEFDLINF